MKILLLLSVLVAISWTACTGSLYWNPLNNACVNVCPWTAPNLYYADASTNSCVKVCPSTPSRYANDYTQSCEPTCPWVAGNYTYYDDYYRRCTLECPANPSYYAHNTTVATVTSGSCVRFCPSGFYARDSTRRCQSTCPNFYFVNNTGNQTVRMCVATCPNTTFVNNLNFCVFAINCPSGQYGDPINKICTSNCPGTSTIKMYADTNVNVKMCVYVCPLGYYAEATPSRKCVQTCTTGFINDVTRECVSICPPGTFSETSPIAKCVTKCSGGLYGYNSSTPHCTTSCLVGTFADSTTYRCVANCPPGYFADSTGTNYVCRLTCSNTSQFGHPLTRICVPVSGCTSPYVYADSTSRQCVTACPASAGTFGHNTSWTCGLTCTGSFPLKDPSTRTCVANCPANPSLYADTLVSGSCVQVCPTIYYAKESTRTCQTACPTDYYAEPVTKKCVSRCPTDPVLTYFSSGSCVQTCPSGTKADPTTLTCITGFCPSNPSYYAEGLWCVTNCSAGLFANEGTRTCDSGCTGILWADNSTRRCVEICPTSPSLFSQDSPNICVDECQPGWFSDNSTRKCVQSCNSSVGYYAHTPLKKCVLICPTGFYNYAGNYTCVPTCPNITGSQYFLDNTTRSCVTSCPDYYVKHIGLGKCVQTCEPMFADESIRTCVATCNSTLDLYRDQTTWKCVQICPLNTFGDYSDPADKKCVSVCPSGWYSDNSTWTCVQSCPSIPSYYKDTSLGMCVFTCRAEIDQFALDVGRICVTDCPSGYYADNSTRRCLIDCLIVPSTYRFNETVATSPNSTCVQQCPLGYFGDNSTRDCVNPCPSSPDYYGDELSRLCVTSCPETATTIYYADNFRATRLCVDTCPVIAGAIGMTYRDKLSRRCVSVNLCTGQQFSDNSTGDCVKKCPSPMFGQLPIKQCVEDCSRANDTYAENQTRLCLKTCPVGKFADNDTQTCVQKCPTTPTIPTTQATFGDRTTNRCVHQCPDAPAFLFADNATQQCVSRCPGQTYGRMDTRVCQVPLNCTPSTFADPFTKRCVSNCPPTQGTYANNGTQKCQTACTGLLFADNSSWACVSRCNSTPPYYGYLNKCLSACPNNTYADNDTQTCVPLCPDTAPFNTYADPTSQKCVLACPFDYYADTRAGFRICVQMCPQGWYADDVSKQCVVMCPQTNGTYGENTTNRCVPICPNGTFGQNTTRICRDVCPSPSFADPSVHVCVITCAAVPNLFGDSFSNTCVLKCPVDRNTFADNSTRLCVPNCPASDQTFADPLTQRCVKTCPVSAITFADNQTRSCVGIDNCRYNGSYKSYSDNSTLRCVTGCPDIPPYFADDLSHRCVALCPQNITYAENVSRKCLPICPAGQFLYADPTLETCVPICPGGYFADNHTQTCVLRCSYIQGVIDSFGYHANKTCLTGCPTGWYAQNSTRECVQNCPKDEYADTVLLRCVLECDKSKPEYADNTTNMCVPVCPTRPDMFNYNGTRFICVLHCPPGLWASDHNRSCVSQCPGTPAYWSDNSTGRCVAQCPFSLFTYSENISRTCTLTCPYYSLGDVRNTFADDSTKSCVTTCPTNPWTYADNSTKACVFRCPANSWGENLTRRCVANCASYGFSDDTTNFCVAVCPNGYFAENSTSACVQECPSGSFADNSSWICVATCPVNPALYADVTNQKCVVTCANDYYGDDSTQTCVQSCNDPQYFAYDPTKRCIRNCLYPYFGEISSKKCVLNCVPGMYKNMTTHLCTACPTTCRTCQGQLLCLTCITLTNYKFYLYNGTCLTGCTSGSPPCASACPATTLSGTITYANPLSQSCVQTCPLNYYGLNTTQYCVQDCPINYYASTVTQRCQLCVNGCNNCTNATYCFSCYPGFLFSNNLCIAQCSSTLTFYYNGACVAACPDGTYLMSDQITCNNCSSKCATCAVSATNCIRCVGAFLYNNDCVNKCPTNYYSDANLVCQPCTSSTPQCNVQPLTYTLRTFNQNNELYAILTFNRQVVLNISQIRSIINITLKGIPSNSYTWDATRINSTSFKITINTTVSITQEILDTTTNGQMEYQTSESIDEISIILDILQPNAITDSSGNVVQTSTVETSLPSYDYIAPEVIQASSSIATFAKGLAWFAVAILLVLMLKGSYPMLFVLEVFQIVYFHAFIIASLPYNFQTFVGNLSILNLQFLPNIFKTLVVPSTHISPATPLQYKTLVGEITFMVSAGHYFTLLIIYLVIAIIFAILKERVFQFCQRIRMFAKRQYLLRFKYGAVNEFIWFSFMTFGFFSMFQMKDLTATEPWMYGNLVLSFLCFVVFISFPVFTIWKALKYRKDMSKLPKKFAFIQGDQSFIPYQIPLRYFRKLLLCCFLVIGTIEIQVPCMIASNFLMLAFYLFFKPSKSPFTNWINILVEVCYLGLQIMLLIFANDTGMSTDMKLTYGKGMIGFALVAILLALIWTVWQFLLFLYEWKLIRDIILEAQLANKIYPEEDNLKVDLEKDYAEEDKVLSESNSILNPIKERRSDDGNILGIQQQFNEGQKFIVYSKEKNEKAQLQKQGLGIFPKKKVMAIAPQEEIDSSVDLRLNSSSGFEEVNKPLKAVKKSKEKKVSKAQPRKNAPADRKKMWNDVDLEQF